jgi:pimeloyl-ACP methyl ester carboxylesterase
MHGTSRLFGRLMSALPNWLTPKLVEYPTDVVLGYDELVKRIEPPDGHFAIVAESYSGPVAIRFATRSPANLCGLVLVATFVRSPRPLVPCWAARLVRPWLFKLPLPQVGLRQALLGDDAPREQIEEVCVEQRRCRPEVSAARVRDVLTVDVRNELREVSVPMLYLAGCRDRVVPPRVVREFQALRPDIEVVTLDSPHAVLQRRPVEAARAIGRFLLEKCPSTREPSAR